MEQYLQITHFTLNWTRRTTLRRLQYPVTTSNSQQALLNSVHMRTTVASSMRNKHRKYHLGRKKACVKSIKGGYDALSTARWIDAAIYPNGECIDRCGHLPEPERHRQDELASATCGMHKVAEAEEAAIILAISSYRQNKKLYLRTECQSPCRV